LPGPLPRSHRASGGDLLVPPDERASRAALRATRDRLRQWSARSSRRARGGTRPAGISTTAWNVPSCSSDMPLAAMRPPARAAASPSSRALTRIRASPSLRRILCCPRRRNSAMPVPSRVRRGRRLLDGLLGDGLRIIHGLRRLLHRARSAVVQDVPHRLPPGRRAFHPRGCDDPFMSCTGGHEDRPLVSGKDSPPGESTEDLREIPPVDLR